MPPRRSVRSSRTRPGANSCTATSPRRWACWCWRWRCWLRAGAASASRRCWPRRRWSRSPFRCTCRASTSPLRCWRRSAKAWLLFAALRWSNLDLARAGALTLMVIVFQALLGMWTVTWLLKPVVVMGHLLGGLLTFSLLTWMAWRATDLPIRLADATKLRAAGDRRPGAARRADRARRLDQRQLCRARLRHRFPQVRRPMVAAARFPRRLRAVARHRRRLRRRRARWCSRASRSSWRTG